ncbi:MAG: hypothetical protein [Caudoviricetes sp.]|nr:MAG: hypothetical protein [Caudoviricetes sp.]
MTKRDEAKQDYLAGMKYKDIAEKYGVTLNTVKSWKTRHWNKESDGAPVEKSVHTKTKKCAHKKELHPAIQELEDSDLNPKQKAFVMEYVRLSNATQAYINAYDVEYETAGTAGQRLLQNVAIQNEIKRLRQARLEELGVGVFDLIDDIEKEARADIGDFLKFGGYDLKEKDFRGKVVKDVDGNQVIDHRSWIQIKDQDKLDTRAIKKISKGKDGLVLELHDRNKARDKLLDYLLATGQFEKLSKDDEDKTIIVDDVGISYGGK